MPGICAIHDHAAWVRSLACVALIALLASCSKPAHTPIAAGATVLALGDSLTYGTGATAQTSYPAVLAQLTGWHVVNAGVPGETAAQGCARLADLLVEHRPQLVLVLLGGNDFLGRLPEQGIREALANCVQDARTADAPLVLLPVPRLGGNGLNDAPLYAEIAKSLQVPLVDAGLASFLAQRSMRADTVHLNEAGYRAMAERIVTGLRELGFVRR
jgi:acyl-CoA thioesterase I